MKPRSAQLALSSAMSLFLVIGLVENAGARGERGGGGFSRSGPAASGGFSSGATGTASRQAGATQRSGQRAETQQTATRQAGATERSGQRAETQQTRTETRGETRTSGQQERTERQGQRQEGYTERTDVRQQGMTERTQTRSQAAQNISGNWDNHYHDDDEWGYALAGAAVGATAGYIAGAATATPAPAAASPTYVAALPCTPSVVTVNGANYYRCDGTWYNRSYVNGSVSYLVVTPPPGY